MVTPLVEGAVLGDVLKFELDQRFCRKTHPVLTGQSLGIGDICEFDTTKTTEKKKVTVAVDEVQSIVFGGTPTGGTFVLWVESIDGIMVPTTALAYNASAATISTALDVALGAGNPCVATGTTLPDNTITFTYSGTGFTGTPRKQIVVDISLSTGGSPTAAESTTTQGHASGGLADSICTEVVVGADEVQSLVHGGTPTGGTFTLSVEDKNGVLQTTTALAYNASAATITTALDVALESGAVVMTGTTLPDQTHTATFSGDDYSGRTKPLITYDLSSLTGGTPTLAVSRTTVGTGPNAVFIERGPAILDYAGLNYNSTTEATVNTALEALGILVRTGPTYTKLSDQVA
jgi:hypothetical protein